MKIFRKKNDKEVVYVQLQDIGFLKLLNAPIPDSIKMKTFGQGIKIGNDNYYDYICFDEAEEINFFRNIDAIINFDEYVNLDLKELEEKAHEIVINIINIVNSLNLMSIDVRKSNSKMLEYFEKLEYMLLCISMLYESKSNNEISISNDSNQIKKILN